MPPPSVTTANSPRPLPGSGRTLVVSGGSEDKATVNSHCCRVTRSPRRQHSACVCAPSPGPCERQVSSRNPASLKGDGLSRLLNQSCTEILRSCVWCCSCQQWCQCGTGCVSACPSSVHPFSCRSSHHSLLLTNFLLTSGGWGTGPTQRVHLHVSTATRGWRSQRGFISTGDWDSKVTEVGL